MKIATFAAVLLLCLVSAASAVGPELPAIPKYSAFEVRGVVISVFNQFPFPAPCPSGYEEQTVKIFVNSDVGTVAVIFPEGSDLPSVLDCVHVSGMLLPPCHGDGQPIAVVSNMSQDGTCE